MKAAIRRILLDLKLLEIEVSILFVDSDQMADANRRYMNRKGPTDVLSFPAADIPLISPLAKPLGDLMVCMDVVRQNARKHRRLVRIELTHILIHGILHLIGYDHQTPFQNRSMRKKERTLLPRVSPILIGAIRT